MLLLAIDPGPEESAFVVLDGHQMCLKDKLPNLDMLRIVQDFGKKADNRCVIEKIASYGMAVGQEVFETVYWSGRFAEAFGADRCERIPRLKVKMHLCHRPQANDSNIRQALIDRFGPGKERAIGKKSAPGPLYGVAGDVWAALAVGITWWDEARG